MLCFCLNIEKYRTKWYNIIVKSIYVIIMSVLIIIFGIAIVLLTIFVAYDSLCNYDDRAYGFAVATYLIGYTILSIIMPYEMDALSYWVNRITGNNMLIWLVVFSIIYYVAWRKDLTTTKLICVYYLTFIFTPIFIAIGYFVWYIFERLSDYDDTEEIGTSYVREEPKEEKKTYVEPTVVVPKPIAKPSEPEPIQVKEEDILDAIRRRERWAAVYGSDDSDSTDSSSSSSSSSDQPSLSDSYWQNSSGDWIGNDGGYFWKNSAGDLIGSNGEHFWQNSAGDWIGNNGEHYWQNSAGDWIGNNGEHYWQNSAGDWKKIN